MNTRIKNGGEVMKKSLFASIFMVLPFVFVCFGLSPTGRAVVPAPDGGYPGFNTAEGQDALFSLTSGVGNTANGAFALYKNRTANGNTATGLQALFRNTTGHSNTAIGYNALVNNTIGDGNIAVGFGAGENLTTGSNNIVIGAHVLGVAGESNTIRIGTKETQTATFIAGISGK